MSAEFNAAAEAARLRKTIALADEAIREAASHRSAAHAPGETIEETAARWSEAARIEEAAKDCRKAARAALVRISGLVVTAPEDHIARIETARCAALALKAAIDDAQEAAQRRRVDIRARQMAEAARKEATR